MKLTINTTFALTTMIASGFVSTPAQADTFHHIDQLAVSIQRQAQSLRNEVLAHYQHTPEFAHMLIDTQQLLHTAAHIHAVVHTPNSLYHLKSDLAKLDRDFHHIENLFERVTHNANHHGVGHVHGRVGHVFGLLKQMENNIHHLREDVEVLTPPPVSTCPLGNSGHGISPYYQTNPYNMGYGHGMRSGYRSHSRSHYRGAGISYHGSRGRFTLQIGSHRP